GRTGAAVEVGAADQPRAQLIERLGERSARKDDLKAASSAVNHPARLARAGERNLPPSQVLHRKLELCTLPPRFVHTYWRGEQALRAGSEDERKPRYRCRSLRLPPGPTSGRTCHDASRVARCSDPRTLVCLRPGTAGLRTLDSERSANRQGRR